MIETALRPTAQLIDEVSEPLVSHIARVQEVGRAGQLIEHG
jgi:hypothetical protein